MEVSRQHRLPPARRHLRPDSRLHGVLERLHLRPSNRLRGGPELPRLKDHKGLRGRKEHLAFLAFLAFLALPVCKDRLAYQECLEFLERHHRHQCLHLPLLRHHLPFKKLPLLLPAEQELFPNLLRRLKHPRSRRLSHQKDLSLQQELPHLLRHDHDLFPPRGLHLLLLVLQR